MAHRCEPDLIIRVLHHQVTGIASKEIVFHLTLTTFANSDHFADYCYTRILALVQCWQRKS